MSTTLSSALKFSISAALSQAPALGTAAHNLNYSQTYSLQAGSTAGSANLVYENVLTIAASGNTIVNLSSLTDALGNSINFALVRCMMIYAHSTNTNNVLVGGAATNPWFSWCNASTDTVTVRPNGFMMVYANDTAGYVVTPSTNINLEIANSGSGTSVICDLILIGA